MSDRPAPPSIILFNTLGRQEMEFVPVEPGQVRLYCCGPTVYNFAHLGNLRTYIFEDLLRRMFTYFGYQVRHVMNVTDVGHLTSDADSGEDRMLLGARREGKTVWEIARYYEQVFFADLADLNVWPPHVRCRATDHIPEMIALVERLLAKGYAYQAGGNVYFSVDRFPRYGELALLQVNRQQAGARVDVDEYKRNPYDFVLWFTESKFPDQEMKWESPWGTGFPGWHVECSAMALKYLGDRVDLHCGGIDHIPVHHTNEIAQSEAFLGPQAVFGPQAILSRRWVNYWLHGEFLILKKDRMSKSSGVFLTLEQVRKRSLSPAAYRYFCLSAHYRSKLQFDWEALHGAQNALETIRNRYLDWQTSALDFGAGRAAAYRREFAAAIAHDLDTPQALATLWKMLRDQELGDLHKSQLLLDFDQVLGLGAADWQRQSLPAELQDLLDQRQAARQRKDFAAADALRAQLLASGVAVKDTPQGPQWYFTRKRAGTGQDQ